MSFLNWTMGYLGRAGGGDAEFAAPRASRWGVTIDAGAARGKAQPVAAAAPARPETPPAPVADAAEPTPALEFIATFVATAVSPEVAPALALTALNLEPAARSEQAAEATLATAAEAPSTPVMNTVTAPASVAPVAPLAPRQVEAFISAATAGFSRTTGRPAPSSPARGGAERAARTSSDSTVATQASAPAPVREVARTSSGALEGARPRSSLFAGFGSLAAATMRLFALPARGARGLATALASMAAWRPTIHVPSAPRLAMPNVPSIPLPRFGSLVSRAQATGAQWATPLSTGGRSHAPNAPGGGGSGPLAPGVSPHDMLDEVIAGLFSRPGRMFLTVAGMAIGLGALVATLGLASTAGNRVLGQFDALAATEVQARARFASTSDQAELLPWDASDRLQRLAGVVAAGTKSSVNVGDALVSTSPVFDPQRQSDFKLSVQAVSPSLYTAVRAEVRSGRLPDIGHSQRAERVAVLGPAAAERLGITSVEQLPSIRIGDNVFLVIGILESVARAPDLLGSVIIPEGTARRDYRLLSPESVVVETAVGATNLISQQTPLALRPDDARAVQVASPPEPQRVRDAVESDLSVLFLVLGVVSLIVGAIGIANVTLISVIERTGEIGLRRAIGASRFHIALQFLCESGAMGFAGGILGASAGTLVVVGTSAYLGWTPVLNAGVPFAAPVVGAITGFVSGLYPAMRAARLEPVEALRGGS